MELLVAALIGIILGGGTATGVAVAVNNKTSKAAAEAAAVAAVYAVIVSLFIYKDITFTHNGAIRPATALNNEIDPKYLALCQGDTDSERYFYYILTEIDKSDFITGIKNAVNYVRKNQEYSSINGMVMNEDYYVVIAEYDLMEIPAIFTEDYYELKFKKSQDSVIVGSSGWNQDGWEVLPNHHLLVVNRKTLNVEIIKLD